jgi:hypothetical protein
MEHDVTCGFVINKLYCVEAHSFHNSLVESFNDPRKLNVLRRSSVLMMTGNAILESEDSLGS